MVVGQGELWQRQDLSYGHDCWHCNVVYRADEREGLADLRVSQGHPRQR